MKLASVVVAAKKPGSSIHDRVIHQGDRSSSPCNDHIFEETGPTKKPARNGLDRFVRASDSQHNSIRSQLLRAEVVIAVDEERCASTVRNSMRVIASF